MFDVTPDEIALLRDADLRELVGRLCEAELVLRGLSPAAVTWGGHQNAADGGLDVRVSISSAHSIDGYISRLETGFQVKIPDMPRSEILSEMRPGDTIRPVIQELAINRGSYIIVSANGSTADFVLQNRRTAMREALFDVQNADGLHTDFFDRTRLATWVRRHPGIVAWVKQKIGRAHSGWRPYGPWSGSSEGIEADYLMDETLRLHLGGGKVDSLQPVAEAIDDLRDMIAPSGKVVRLVGLSGVGKTRLVQALFDPRIGNRPIPKSLAVYTDIADAPDPSPQNLATVLLANHVRAILIIDNCPPDLHSRLSDVCRAAESTISVLTVEYDIREDQPEGTEVVTLETSSVELVAQIIARRYPHLSRVDIRTIADWSGGNARIAIALAETVKVEETIKGLTDDALFERLFKQRHDNSDSLLVAARVCALLYSFDGENIIESSAELPRLAALAGQPILELARHVNELLVRRLAQNRGEWRAILPHAIANRLAARALNDIPFAFIDKYFVTEGTDRLARSFSRRLSFLHEHPKAIEIVEHWLSPSDLLGNANTYSALGNAMFQNIAPVSPSAALSTLERSVINDLEVSTMTLMRHRTVLRSIAYESELFGRSAALLADLAVRTNTAKDNEQTKSIFLSMFTIKWSGTHAPGDMRLKFIENLLRSENIEKHSLGLSAISKVLLTGNFNQAHQFNFNFGSRMRDYGWSPKNRDELIGWYSAALGVISKLAAEDEILKAKLRRIVAQNFCPLWLLVELNEKLEQLMIFFATGKFWPDGWMACRQAINLNSGSLTEMQESRLRALERLLKPLDTADHVRAIVLGDSRWFFDIADDDESETGVSSYQKSEKRARELGAIVAKNDTVFSELLPELFAGGQRVLSFGHGLADVIASRNDTWMKLVDWIRRQDVLTSNIQIMWSFLFHVHKDNRKIALQFVDYVYRVPELKPILPNLYTAIEIDDNAVDQLKQLLVDGSVSVKRYSGLAGGRVMEHISSAKLRELVLLISDQEEGFDIAVAIIAMQLYYSENRKQNHEDALIDVGRILIQRATFKEEAIRNYHNYEILIKYCAFDDAKMVADLTEKLFDSIRKHDLYYTDLSIIFSILLHCHSSAFLDTLLESSRKGYFASYSESIFGQISARMNQVTVDGVLDWCDRGGRERFLFVASLISFSAKPSDVEPLTWSSIARSLVSHAPNPTEVLSIFIERFRPSSWSGSRASLMEANACLLDQLDWIADPDTMAFVTDEKKRLRFEIDAERRDELKRNRLRDERFE